CCRALLFFFVRIRPPPRPTPFPYTTLFRSAVARAYDAACTPDFFGFNGELTLQYRGRLDASRKQAHAPGLRRDLLEAMKHVARTDRKSTRLNSSHVKISYAVFCLKKKRS